MIVCDIIILQHSIKSIHFEGMGESILIWQQKGGVGKTTIACELISRLKYLPITNEGNSALFDFFENKENQEMLGEKSNPVILIKNEIPDNDAFKQEFVFDFGGYVDERLVDAIKYCKFLVIPLTPKTADTAMFFKSLDALAGLIAKQGKIKIIKIAIVINMIEKTHEKFLDVIKSAIIAKMASNGFDGQFKIFEIPKTEGLNNIFLEQVSIMKIACAKRHLKRHFEPISKTFDSMAQFLNE